MPGSELAILLTLLFSSHNKYQGQIIPPILHMNKQSFLKKLKIELPEVRLLDHMVLQPIYISTNSVQVFPFLHILPSTYLLCF